MGAARSVAVVLALVALSATTVRADPIPSLDLRGFYPPADPHGSLYLEPSATPEPGAWNVGVVESYSYRLVTLRDASDRVASVPLAHQLSLDYLGSLGIADRLALGLALPTVLYQRGDDLREVGVSGAGPLPRTALGDAALLAKVALVRLDQGFGLAALGRVTAPTGHRRAYLGEGAVTGELRVLGELDLLVLALRATAGAKVRGKERTYVGETFGHELPWGVGVAVRPQTLGIDDRGRWEWFAELHGAVAITPRLGAAAQSPALWGLAARYSPGDVSAFAGVEMPVNSAVGVPRVRAVIGLGWTPRFKDADHDGIADDVDQCPELAEDRDGFEDQDGCPDLDNDGDGVSDADDACPNQPGPADAERPGCPP
jgi:OmpA-OmpF porin, OOP family